MDVFISWSGDRSKAIAELLKTWLKCVVQASNPWVSSQNISPGTVWFTQISERLNSSSIGIVCLTQENKNNPWILFEAGALAKGLADTRVCTLLIDLTPIDIQPPLSQFNATLPNKEGLWMLVQQVNGGLGDRMLDSGVLQAVFETYWSKFEIEFQNILGKTEPGEPTPERTPDSLLTEILQTTRDLVTRMDKIEGGLNCGEVLPQNRSSSPFSLQGLNDIATTEINGNSFWGRLARDEDSSIRITAGGRTIADAVRSKKIQSRSSHNDGSPDTMK
jgi:hypothetical protein